MRATSAPKVWLWPTCLPPWVGPPVHFWELGAILSRTPPMVWECGLVSESLRLRKLLDSVLGPAAEAGGAIFCPTSAAAAAAEEAGSINGEPADAAGGFRADFFLAGNSEPVGFGSFAMRGIVPQKSAAATRKFK